MGSIENKIFEITLPFHQMNKKLILLLVVLQATEFCHAQGDLKVVKELSEYIFEVRQQPEKKMVELKDRVPAVIYDLRYATKNNFMRRRMYSKKTIHTFLRTPAAEALAKVQAELKNIGLGLKIFDAYRPYSVSKKFWKLVKDERYVANPARGSNHNRGTAVDLTIIQLDNGRDLSMGTDFDNFTDTAHHSFTKLPDEVLRNRLLLKKLMEKHGFVALETEWWHYTFKSSTAFEVLDIPFKKLLNF